MFACCFRNLNQPFNYQIVMMTFMILIILVHFAESAKINIKTMSSSRKTSLTKNSPIYYIATNLINRPSVSSVSHSPSMIMSVPSYHHSNTVKSQFYKLPIQFLSNAKPIEVIKGNVFCFFPFHLSSFIFHLSSFIFHLPSFFLISQLKSQLNI